MRFLAIDFGGTRLKSGLRTDSGWMHLQATDTPRTLRELQEAVKRLWVDHQPQAWGMTLPGAIRPNDNYWFVPRAPFDVPTMFAREFGALVANQQIPLPMALESDTKSMAFGLIKNSGTCLQISTGVGGRAIRDHQLMTDPEDVTCEIFHNLNTTIWTSPHGNSREFRRWLGHKAMQQDLPKPQRGLPWRELAGVLDEEHLHAAVAYAETALGISKEPNLFLGGGGSIALAPRLRPLLASRGINVEFAKDSILPGLEGLWILATRPNSH